MTCSFVSLDVVLEVHCRAYTTLEGGRGGGILYMFVHILHNYCSVEYKLRREIEAPTLHWQFLSSSAPVLDVGVTPTQKYCIDATKCAPRVSAQPLLLPLGA